MTARLRFERVILLVFTVCIVAALACYLPLLRESFAARGASVRFFATRVAPFAFLHATFFLVVAWTFSRRSVAAIAYWALTLGIFLVIAGSGRIVAFFLAIMGVVALTAIGNLPVRRLFHPEARSLGLSLGFGILLTSIIGVWLAVPHFFHWWTVGPILLALALAGIRPLTIRPRLRSRTWLRHLDVARSWELLLAGEVLLLLFLLTMVWASAPEQRSDAIRIYLPYVKMLRTLGGLPDLPLHWSFVIPQAGITYLGAGLVLLGPIATRFGMLIALGSLAAISISMARGEARVVSAALTLVVVSCPIILLLSASHMQDIFVSLAVLVLAVTAIGSSMERPMLAWFFLGILAGVCWSAKFTTVTFAAPLFVFALFRLWREKKKWSITAASIALATLGGLLSAGPWLWHSYRESGNPVFPFLRNLFPSPNWPHGAGTANLSSFRLENSVPAWLLSPFSFTFHSSRYVEGYDGSIGLVLLLLLGLAIPAVINTGTKARVWAGSAVVGAALLWITTAYIRYWLPAFWLLLPAAIAGARLLFRTRVSRLILLVLCSAVALAQIPFAMTTSWLDPEGIPWDYYSGKTSDTEYIQRRPGFNAMALLSEIDPAWPRAWFTGSEAVGHWPVIPIEANVWEFAIHDARTPEAARAWLERPCPDYWIIDMSSTAAAAFRDLGFDQDYWTDNLLVASDGAFHIYRFASSVRAKDAWNGYIKKTRGESTDDQ